MGGNKGTEVGTAYLGEQVLGKLQSITDEEFAEISLEAAEDM